MRRGKRGKQNLTKGREKTKKIISEKYILMDANSPPNADGDRGENKHGGKRKGHGVKPKSGLRADQAKQLGVGRKGKQKNGHLGKRQNDRRK